eukprot:2770005-Pyramimonas_sp.AAC.1
MQTHGFATSVCKTTCARALANSWVSQGFSKMSMEFCEKDFSRRTPKSLERPCARAGGGGAVRAK